MGNHGATVSTGSLSERDADGNITQEWAPTWEKPEDICDTLIEDYEAERS